MPIPQNTFINTSGGLGASGWTELLRPAPGVQDTGAVVFHTHPALWWTVSQRPAPEADAAGVHARYRNYANEFCESVGVGVVRLVSQFPGAK